MGKNARERARQKAEAKQRGGVARGRAWTIVLPTRPAIGPPQRVPKLVRLNEAHLKRLVASGVYSQDEMDAFRGADVSWGAEPERMFGPLTTEARVGGRVVGGVELWQQQRDEFWFLEAMIRDPAPEFKGVGADVLRATIEWWRVTYAGTGYGLRVHSMVREEAAASWWTWQIGRPPDFTDAFVRNSHHVFPAVGWILHPALRPPAPAEAVSPADHGRS